MGHFTTLHFGFEAAAWYWHFVGATVRLYQMNKVTSDWVTRRLGLPWHQNCQGTTACLPVGAKRNWQKAQLKEYWATLAQFQH